MHRGNTSYSGCENATTSAYFTTLCTSVRNDTAAVAATLVNEHTRACPGNISLSLRRCSLCSATFSDGFPLVIFRMISVFARKFAVTSDTPAIFALDRIARADISSAIFAFRSPHAVPSVRLSVRPFYRSHGISRDASTSRIARLLYKSIKTRPALGALHPSFKVITSGNLRGRSYRETVVSGKTEQYD